MTQGRTSNTRQGVQADPDILYDYEQAATLGDARRFCERGLTHAPKRMCPRKLVLTRDQPQAANLCGNFEIMAMN